MAWLDAACAAVDSLLDPLTDAGSAAGGSAIKLARDAADAPGTMAGERPRYGLLVSALGAVVLAIAVFLPWYGVSFTADGIAFAQQVGNQVAAQYGNATLQSYMASLHSETVGLAGHEFLSLSAHQALKTLNVVLLIVGGDGLRDRAVRARRLGLRARQTAARWRCSARWRPFACSTGWSRRLRPPGELFALSLREGAWLALLGAVAMVAGALWPAGARSRTRPAHRSQRRVVAAVRLDA